MPGMMGTFTPSARALHQSIAQVGIDVLAAVGGDIDIGGRKLCQAVDGAKQASDARTLERREHFKTESRGILLMDEVDDIHGMEIEILGKSTHFGLDGETRSGRVFLGKGQKKWDTAVSQPC